MKKDPRPPTPVLLHTPCSIRALQSPDLRVVGAPHEPAYAKFVSIYNYVTAVGLARLGIPLQSVSYKNLSALQMRGFGLVECFPAPRTMRKRDILDEALWDFAVWRNGMLGAALPLWRTHTSDTFEDCEHLARANKPSSWESDFGFYDGSLASKFPFDERFALRSERPETKESGHFVRATRPQELEGDDAEWPQVAELWVTGIPV